jgi:hypothetical protein
MRTGEIAAIETQLSYTVDEAVVALAGLPFVLWSAKQWWLAGRPLFFCPFRQLLYSLPHFLPQQESVVIVVALSSPDRFAKRDRVDLPPLDTFICEGETPCGDAAVSWPEPYRCRVKYGTC